MVEQAVREFGRIDFVVNNAGIVRDVIFHKMTEADWDAVVAVHLKGSFNMNRHACEYWREEHKKGNILNGRIITTCSDAGLIGSVGQVNYGSCKAALAMMAIAIDNEMAKYGVTANSIAPLARTRMTTDATPSSAPIFGREVQPGEFDVFGPENIAPLVVWLASDDAKDVHGEVFRVGVGAVWLMKGWHTAGKISKRAIWEPAELGEKLKVELAKGLTAKEDMREVFASVMS
jgi:NAD(P)-dependent dehydrogenase (short-subunit alcohol dehydrogenase family)